jgi:hypothetical protein
MSDGLAGPGEAHPLQTKPSAPKNAKLRDLLNTPQPHRRNPQRGRACQDKDNNWLVYDGRPQPGLSNFREESRFRDALEH